MSRPASNFFTPKAFFARAFGVVLSLAVVIPAPAALRPERLRQFQSQYVLEIDANTLTRGDFQGRLRFEFNLDYRALTGITSSTDTETSDLGTEVTTTTFVVGAPTQGDLSIYVDGRLAGRAHYGSISFATASTDRVPEVDHPVYLMRFGLGINALEIHDRLGKRALISIDPANALNLFIDSQTHEYLRFTDALGLSGALVTDTNHFGFKENLSGQQISRNLPCQYAGQVQEVSKLPLAVGLQLERTQLCVVAPQGLTPVVLFKNNPPHEPEENIEKTNRTALSAGGFKTARPLFPLPSLSSANCVGYALLAILGPQALPKNAYWVENQSAQANFSLGTYPAQVLVAANFHKVKEVAAGYYDSWAEVSLAADAELKAGDLILFAGTAGYAHAGVVIPHGGKWWIEHKFEEGEVLNTPIANIHDVIPNLYSKILIYRAK